MSSVLEKTLDFASRGFRVFPVHKKVPQLEKWPDLATTDQTIIKEWYTGKYKYCDGFGVCPGRELVVIDVDVKEGKKGKESLQKLRELGLEVNTMAVRTKSGGLHLYYKFPSFIPDSMYIKSVTKWCGLDGIDLRGTRGFVVGPTETNGYKLIRDQEPLELSEPLREKLPIGSVVRENVNTNTANQLISEESSALRGNIPQIIPKGERHDTLIRLMASWARKISYDNALVLLEEAISRCEDQDKDPIDINEYIPRLEEAYDKFKPVIEDKLDWMLDNLVYIETGPRVYDISTPGKVLKLHEARGLYANWITWEEKNDGATRPVPVFDRWIKHVNRKTSPHVGYKPIKATSYVCGALGVEVINSYRPPNIRELSVEPDVGPFLDFVDFLLEEDSEVFLDWCAHLVQQPEKKLTWAPIIVSVKEGMGKNFMFNIMAHMLGPWNTKNITAGLFIKTFNTFLVNSVLVLINELEEVDSKRRYEIVSKLKGYITESHQTIEPKGIDAYTTEIFTNFILFSNKEDAVHISDDSRRFFVHINYQNPRPQSYYEQMFKWLNEGGYEAIYTYLKRRDLSNFAWYGRAPTTDSKSVMVEAGMTTEEKLIRQAIENRYSVFVSDIVTQDSLLYFIAHKLPKGIHVHPSRIKYIMREIFQSLPLKKGGRRGRQVRLPNIDPRSDSDLIIKGSLDNYRCVVYSCRNHSEWEYASIDKITAEYEKIFDSKGNESSLRVVK